MNMTGAQESLEKAANENAKGVDISNSVGPSWAPYLQDEFRKPYMNDLREFLRTQYASGKTIYPQKANYFRSFQLTPFDKVKVVILGQDPYHGPGQAHGLSFSVPEGQRLPPSLQNIYKELVSDLGIDRGKKGNLEDWAKQGVLLLNSVLTVVEHQAASHKDRGWEKFTDQVIRQINEHREHVVFVLWGSYAQKKAAFVDRKRHLVLESVHPSPLSSHRGFFGSKPFSKINTYLQQTGQEPIHW